jgi:hypothetical protein
MLHPLFQSNDGIIWLTAFKDNFNRSLLVAIFFHEALGESFFVFTSKRSFRDRCAGDDLLPISKCESATAIIDNFHLIPHEAHYPFSENTKTALRGAHI